MIFIDTEVQKWDIDNLYRLLTSLYYVIGDVIDIAMTSVPGSRELDTCRTYIT